MMVHRRVRYDALMDTLTHSDSVRAVEVIAEGVRRRRAALGWTLDTAARRAGVSRRLLAQVEAAEANPSLSTLLALATGLDLALTDLLGGASEPPIEVHDHDTAPILWNGPRGGRARLLAGCGPLEVWEWSLGAGESYAAEAHRDGSREILSVRRGSVEVVVGTSAPVVVCAGQSATFHADVPHRYRTVGRGTAEFTLAVHEPIGGRS